MSFDFVNNHFSLNLKTILFVYSYKPKVIWAEFQHQCLKKVFILHVRMHFTLNRNCKN